MIHYADSSALIKLYLDEPGAIEFRDSATLRQLVTSLVAYSEIRAGLARALRDSRLTRAEYDTQLGAFKRDWEQLDPVDVSDSLVRLAGDLAEQYALRGFDAIHLASAVTLRDALAEDVSFAAFDTRLTDAAAACGLVALPA